MSGMSRASTPPIAIPRAANSRHFDSDDSDDPDSSRRVRSLDRRRPRTRTSGRDLKGINGFTGSYHADDNPKPSIPKPINPKPSIPKPINPETITPKPINPETIPPKPINPETITPKPINPETITPIDDVSDNDGATELLEQVCIDNGYSVAAAVVKFIGRISGGGEVSDRIDAALAPIINSLTPIQHQQLLDLIMGNSVRRR